MPLLAKPGVGEARVDADELEHPAQRRRAIIAELVLLDDQEPLAVVEAQELLELHVILAARQV